MSNIPAWWAWEWREAANSNLTDYDYKSAVRSFADASFRNNQIWFYNDVTKANPDENKLKTDFETFIRESSTRKYRWITIWNEDWKLSDIKFMEFLRAHTLWLWLWIETKRKKADEIFLKDYNLEDAQKARIVEQLWKKSQADLEKLLKSQKVREDFLESLFWENKPTLKEKEDFLRWIDFSWVDVSSLTNDQKDAIYAIWNLSRTIYPDDIRDVLGFFQTLEQRQKLIKYFLPTISLRQLIDFWILHRNEAIIAIRNQYVNSIREQWLPITPDVYDYLDIEKLLDETFIATYLFPIEVVDRILNEDWLSNLANELNDIKAQLERENREKCRTRLDLEAWLRWNRKVDWVEKLDVWAVFKLEVKDWQSLEEVYYRVKSLDDENSSMEFVEVWRWKKVFDKNNWNWVTSTKTYRDFLMTLDSKDILRLTFQTFDEFNEMVDNSDNWFSNENFNENSEKIERVKWEVEELKTRLTSIIENEITDNSKKSRLTEIVNALSWAAEDEELTSEFEAIESMIENEDDISQKDVLKRFRDTARELDSKRKESNNLRDDGYAQFLKSINESDPKWEEFWLQGWTCFESNEGWFYEVSWLDKQNWFVTLYSAYWEEILSYQQFLDAFREKNCKRVKKINNFDDFKNVCWEKDDKFREKWKNVSVNVWWFLEQKTDENDKKPKRLDYIVSKNWKEVIKIESVLWDRVIVKTWELKEQGKKWKEKRLLSLSSVPQEISLQELSRYISGKWFEPYFHEWEKEEKEKWWNNKFKWWLFWRYWNTWLSASEVIMAWKTYVDTITDYLKRWNELKSAKFAMMFWWMLWDEIQNELRMKVESANTEQMEKAMKQLWSIDSNLATKLIEKWLNDKNTPQYKKEAWLIFMVEKYGSLYTKDMFKWKNHRNNFLWYEALWWRKGDALYMQVKADMKKDDVQFSEEELIYRLLVIQCRANKRPSRLHKRYKSSLPKWISEEVETWVKDGWDPMTVKWRIDWALWELWWWTYANTIWWIEQIVNKWWSMKELNTVPFVMLFSWVWYHLDQKIAAKFNKLLWKWIVLPIWFFLAKRSRADTFNNTVIDLCREIQSEYWGEFPDILDDALKMRANQENPSRKTTDNIKDAEKFWKKYWEVLWGALNMLSLWSNDKYSRVTKSIQLKKDENPNYKAYDDIMKWAYSNSTFTWWDADWYMTDAFDKKWISWVDLVKVWSWVLTLSPGWGFTSKETWNWFWQEITAEVDSIKTREFSKDSTKNKALQKKYLQEYFKELIYVLLQNNSNLLHSMSDPSTIVWWPLSKRWINLKRDFNWYDANRVKAWEASEVISRLVDNYLSWNVRAQQPLSFDSISENVRFWIDNSIQASNQNLWSQRNAA